jgi:hypothetical protein
MIERCILQLQKFQESHGEPIHDEPAALLHGLARAQRFPGRGIMAAK